MRYSLTVLLVALMLMGCSAPTPQTIVPTAIAAPTTAVAPITAATEATPIAEATASPAESGDIALPTPTPSPAQTTPDLNGVRLVLTPVVEGLEQPLFVTHAGDGSGRLFILEKTGKIRVVKDGQLLAEPFLDISDTVSGSSEQGLLGLAFAPDYPESGYFFINYTNEIGDTIIARYRRTADSPDRADPASRDQLLSIDQPAPNHNGGMLAFGPDGMLYVGMGDGGGANDRFGNGQNPSALLGKMLRIDVTSDPEETYIIPADNPWVTADWNGQDVRNEVWAVGLRNPWRFSFDRATGALYIADVGQNRIEEVNYIAPGSPGGLNFGWPIMEGLDCFQAANCSQEGLQLPVAQYTHDGNCSISGGYVYRGQAVPTWDGIYFYADFCSGIIWGLAPNGAGGWNNLELARTGHNISSFGEDEAGEIYVTDLTGGVVYRLTQ